MSAEQYSAAVTAVAGLTAEESLDLLRVLMEQHGWCGTVFTLSDFEELVRDNTPDDDQRFDSEYVNERAVELMDALDYERAQELMVQTGWEYLYQAHDEVFGV